MGSGGKTDPFLFVGKAIAKEKGEAVRFRILSTHPDACRKIDCRIAYRTKAAEGAGKEPKTFEDPIHEQVLSGDPPVAVANNDLTPYTDFNGNQLADNKYTSLYRLPVWVYEKHSVPNPRTGAVTITPINELRYWEVSFPMFQAFLELPQNKQLKLQFDEATNKPYYDLLLHRAGEGQKTWELLGLQLVNGEQHENYNVEDEDAIGADNMALVDEQWEDLQTAMDKIMDDNEIKFKLGTNNAATPGRAIGNKPSMPTVDANADTNRTVAPQAPAAVAEAEEYAETETEVQAPAADVADADTSRTVAGGGFKRRRGQAA